MNWTAEEVRQLRYRMGWSQAEMARSLKLEVLLISRVESGAAELPAEHRGTFLQIFQQAETLSEQMQRRPIAEVMMRNRGLSQIHDLEVIEGIDSESEKQKHKI